MKTTRYEVGTLLRDMGKIGVIYRTIEMGTLKTPSSVINWRFNYEIYYFDGVITVMGHETLMRLVESGAVQLIDGKAHSCVVQEDV